MILPAAKSFAVVGMAVFLTTTADSVFAGEKRPPPVPAQKRPPAFTPEERAKRRQQIKERLSKQVSELQKKKASGSINDEERQRLDRLEVLAGRFRNQGFNPAGAAGVKTPLNNSAAAKSKTK